MTDANPWNQNLTEPDAAMRYRVLGDEAKTPEEAVALLLPHVNEALRTGWFAAGGISIVYIPNKGAYAAVQAVYR